MKILMAATPVAGHLNPLISLAAMLRARGDEVRITTGTTLSGAVRDAGIPFYRLGAGADLDLARIEKIFPDRAAIPAGPEQLRFDFERLFIDTIPAQAETLRRLVAMHRPDVVVTDCAFMGRFVLFAQPRAVRPAIVSLGISFLPLSRPDGAPLGLGLPPVSSVAERAHYADMAIGVDAILNQPLMTSLARTFAALKLDRAVGPPIEMMSEACDVYLQPTVRSFEYDFGPLPERICFIGALPPPGLHIARPHWWDRLDGSRPIVLITQGTVGNFDFDQLVHPALEALADRDNIHIVVTTGGRPVDDVRWAASANLFVAPFLDYRELLPRIALLVTNGGYGTVSLALRSGVPIVAAGLTEDKAEVGARIAWSGVGIGIATERPRVAGLRHAIGRVLDEPSFRERAMAIAADFTAIDTKSTVFDILDRTVQAGRDAARPAA